MLEIEHPIIQAPMAGGATTPGLVAAVSNAGSLGSLGAGYLPPEEIREAIREIRRLTERPFAVNLFIPEDFEAKSEEIENSNTLMRVYQEELGMESLAAPASYAQTFEKQFEVVLEEEVPVFSFTFGALAEDLIGALKERGARVIGTATTVREGLRLEADRVDMVVGQGAEAGAHRGTFMGDFEDAMVGTMALIPQLTDALRAPVIASGGIMDGRGMAASLMLGAGAAQMGTAFLACEESGIHPAYKEAILKANEEDTSITRAFSGKPARGIKNRFLIEMAGRESELPPYPVQNALTRDLRSAAQKQNRPEFMSLWAGQGARLTRSLPAADLIATLLEETEAALHQWSIR
jgi:nitronate monooxygenase